MLEDVAYCPTLYTRMAEVKALARLPSETKARLFPLLVVRPWPRAKDIARVWEKITEALEGGRFAFDLDRSKFNSSPNTSAEVDFNQLFEPIDGFASYYRTVEEVPGAIPVLRFRRGLMFDIERQASYINRIDRGVIVRIGYQSTVNPLSVVDEVLDTFEDVTIFVDAGWSRDILGKELWASTIIERASTKNPEIELVVSGSSFPEDFTSVARRGAFQIDERTMFNNLVRRHNAAHLTYGDWGSTRLPSDAGPMRNVPRIDLPTDSQWITFRRSPETTEDYSSIAQRVVADTDWPANIDIWGTYVIRWTANGEQGAIRSPSTAASARINIHLHRQAFFGGNPIVSDGDEVFTDD